jgi:hypothetical protein
MDMFRKTSPSRSCEPLVLTGKACGVRETQDGLRTTPCTVTLAPGQSITIETPRGPITIEAGASPITVLPDWRVQPQGPLLPSSQVAVDMEVFGDIFQVAQKAEARRLALCGARDPEGDAYFLQLHNPRAGRSYEWISQHDAKALANGMTRDNVRDAVRRARALQSKKT